MATTIRVNENVKKQLKIKAAETGKSQYELANKYILEGLKNDKTPCDTMTIEEIEALLKHDNPKGNKLLNEIDGTIDTGEITDSVKLKKDSYKI